MDMIAITHPSLDEYSDRVIAMANKYHCESWIEINPEVMNSDDGEEFSFIMKSLGDQLIHREFQKFLAIGRPPTVDSFGACISVEPGGLPGSTVCTGVMLERPSICRTY